MFGFARFKNDEYTLYLRLFGFARLSLVWCVGSLALRTKNIHCIYVCLGSHVCMDIAFSVCLGSHALRTKNIHCICDCLGSHASIFIVCNTMY